MRRQIQKILEQKGINMNALATKAQVSYSTVHDLITGQAPVGKSQYKTLHALAQELEMSTDEFVQACEFPEVEHFQAGDEGNVSIEVGQGNSVTEPPFVVAATKKKYNPFSETSREWTHRALDLLDQTGGLDMVCPKCHTNPTMIIEGNRRMMSCECGYIAMGEILF